MRHRDLQDDIKGSILKRNYLEAFLMQSAYIEAVLKYIADFNFFVNLKSNNEGDNVFFREIRKDFGRKSLYDLINFLVKTGAIDKSLSTELHGYRESRNKVLHDLIRQIFNENFDEEIKIICDNGNKILNNDKFVIMIGAIEDIEKGIAQKRVTS